MLRETLAGHNPSHFVGSSIVKCFVLSEIFLWSSWFGILPLFGIFVVQDVQGGNLQLAAYGYSIYLISRVIFELISGKLLAKSSEKTRIYISIIGLVLAGIGILGFAFTTTLSLLYIWFVFTGMGIGIASPAKNSLFSSHLDKNKETTEWGLYDAIVFICIAASTAFGGFIATQYGFRTFFIIAGIWMGLGVIPYLIYLKENHTSKSST